MSSEAPPLRLCPDCFIIQPEPACQTCGAITKAFGTARGRPWVIGRLRLFGGAPGLNELTANWPGLRRYPAPLERSRGRSIVCRHHDGKMIWFWEASWEAFSDEEAGENENKIQDRAYRSLAASHCLLIEAPAPTSPAFRARYVRYRGRESPLSEIDTLLADLEDALDYLNPPLRRIGLLHSDGAAGIGPRFIERLQRRSAETKVFAEEQKALDWCLPSKPLPPASPRPSIKVASSGFRKPGTGHTMLSVHGWIRWLGKLMGIRAPERPSAVTEKFEIALVDVGGTLARGFLSRLHRIKPSVWSGYNVRSVDTSDNRVAVRRLKHPIIGHLPPEFLPAPPWQGIFMHGQERSMSIRLAMEAPDGDVALHDSYDIIKGDSMIETSESNIIAHVIAIGSDRLRGEQNLVEFLDRNHGQPLGSIVLLHADGHSDPELLQWAQWEFDAPVLKIEDNDAATVSYLVSYVLPRRR
uniref:Uncharacterized protein n=1 Tax=Candidatus Kentrum sp. DK TaxID=2126562 RepID=A0A450T1X7_9GAMM|nr:MAG: hypothetical protein BECKDK2373C_GA0170839_10817 [Candidatus Kentron sp. DK]